MERASFAAVGVGVAAIGGLALLNARRNAPPEPPRYAVSRIEARENGDAFLLLTARRVPERAAAPQFRLYDRTGRALPVVTQGGERPATQVGLDLVVRGHAEGDLRLEVWAGGRRFQSLALGATPKPPRQSLRPKADPRFRLVVSESPQSGVTALRLVFRRPVPVGERWECHVVRSTYLSPKAAGFSSMASVPEGAAERALFVPFLDESDAAEILLRRIVVRRKAEEVVVPGLRLVDRFGQTSAQVDREARVRTPSGLVVQMPRQTGGPARKGRAPDRREALFNLGLIGFPPGASYGMELVAPRPEEVGLNSLRVGPHRLGRTTDAPLAPIPRGPFAARLRVMTIRESPAEESRVCLPIERPAARGSAPEGRPRG